VRDLVERYSVDRQSLDDFYNIPLAEAALDRLEAFYREWLDRSEQADFDGLDADGRIDWLLLRNDAGYRLRRVGHLRRRGSEVREQLPFADLIIGLEESRRRMEPLDPRSAATKLVELEEAVVAARRNAKRAAKDDIGAGPVQAHRAATELKALCETLKAWYDHQHQYKPGAGWWLDGPHKNAVAELKKYAKRLRDNAKGAADGMVGEPVGRDALEDDLGHEMLPYGPEELTAIADRELEWCTGEMKRAAEELGHRDDWRAALEHVKDQHVPLGEQDELVSGLAKEAINFVERHSLVTIDDLCRETWYIDMISEEKQRELPFEAYGGQRILVAYPTRGMSHEARTMSVRGNNVHFTRAVTQHELIPGHHLQGYMGRRHSTHRRAFATPFLSEGWCLYWEMLLWDLGFPRGPEDRIGMLFWRMHRCARITVSLRFHLEEMSPEEMVDFLVDNVGHERDCAKAEVRRYIGGDYSPLYQCAYMIGGLQLRALRRELVDTGRMADKEFHDRVLRENAIPIELIRAGLTGAQLPRGFHSTWRFAGD